MIRVPAGADEGSVGTAGGRFRGRWGSIVLVVLAVLGGAAVLVGLRVRRGPPDPAGDVFVEGLDAPVEVLVDSLGVPHVWASSVRDALFAQGYLHARDRLWQMELFRRVAEGRLSEIFGKAALDSDRFLRRLGLRRMAETTVPSLGPEVREALEAYVRGVNAAVEGWRGPLPPEFVLLRFRPGPWDLPLSLAVEKIMAWDLAEYRIGLDLAEARRTLDDRGYALVRPRYPSWGVTILGGAPAGGEVAGAAGVGEPILPGPALVAAARPPSLAARFLDAGSVVRASNSWVVGPTRSRSGRPVLANDMHLALEAPTLWYLMGLHAPGLDVVGMTLPGSPGVVAGHSAAVAWAFTNAMVDDSDFFLERRDPRDSTRYLVPGGSEAFRMRLERIRVRGGGEDTVRVLETRHGPVVGEEGGELLAFRWVAQEPSTTPGAILGMNRARNVEEFLEALEGFSDPHQNVLFADTAGVFGYWLAGRIPRRPRSPPPLLPVPGWTGEFDWDGFLSFQENPHRLNPPEGFLVTANNRQAWDSTTDRINDGHWARPYRAQRIRELLLTRERHDAASLAAIQMDVGSAFVDRFRPRAVEAFRSAGYPELAEALLRWDGRSTREATAPTLFFSWVEALRTGVRGILYGTGKGGFLPLYAVERVLEGEAPWLPADSLAVEAARTVAGRGRIPEWGRAHRLVLDHPLRSVPVLGWFMGFGRGPIPRAGSPHSPNVAAYSGSEPPFVVHAGPSQRHVVDLADPDGSGGFVLPGGQSGLPRHRHSWDQLPLWREGELWLLPLERGGLEGRTERRLRLLPTGGRAEPASGVPAPGREDPTPPA